MIESDRSIPSRYFLSRADDGSIDAMIPAYVARDSTELGDYDVTRLIGRRHDDLYPVLLLGSRSGYANDVVVSSGTGTLRSATRTKLFELIRAYAGEVGAKSIVAMFVTPAAIGELRTGWADGITVFASAHAEIQIDPKWDSFDDYLRTLRSTRRSAGRTVRRDIARFARGNYTLERFPLLEVSDAIAPLIGNLERRYGSSRSDEGIAASLRARGQALGQDAQVLLCSTGDRPIGCSLLYRDARALWCGGTGFDYQARRKNDGVYFTLGYYEPVKVALAEKRHTLNLGVGSYEAKLHRGARLKPLWSFVLPLRAMSSPARTQLERRNNTRMLAFRTLWRHYPTAFPEELWKVGFDE